jgi:hypothetical protein
MRSPESTVVSDEMSHYSECRDKPEKHSDRCLSRGTLADVSERAEEIEGSTNKHGFGLAEDLGEQANDLVMAVFNRFDAEFSARHGNCDIASPPLAGRLHKTMILADTNNAEKNGDNKKYVVQKLRLKPFDLEAVEHMFQLLEVAQEQAESKGAFKEGGVLDGWTKIRYYDAKDGETKEVCGREIGQKILYEHDERGNPTVAWRVMEFVEGRIYDKLADIGGEEKDPQGRRQCQLKAAKLLGEAIARFAILVNFVPKDAQFKDTLYGFHDTQGYVDEVNALLAGKKVPICPGKGTPLAKMIDGLLDGGYQNGKYAARTKRMIEIFRSASSLAGAFESLPPCLQRTIAHGDLKINNVIWAIDETGRPDHIKCFIDLDTIGVYTALDDFGDAARSMINILGEEIWEEDKTLADIVLDREVLEKLIEGYLDAIKKMFGFLAKNVQGTTNDQLNIADLRVCLHRAVATYFFQLGTRFFKAFMSEPAEPADGGNKRHFVYFVKQSEDDLEDRNLRLAEVQYAALVRFLKGFKDELDLDAMGIKPNDIREPLGWPIDS